ncbi:LytR/AlgR family response regulator transcription factor [Psychrosphaera aestuarii]|uniref:LytR/AlgR family response regulator transcription factor n=1 Tax=Psychrosphaera aestuarii TaxID=1266052 RepID=UPI001B32FE2B|nr:LytTR family DNA-binding domain-containing protein [Psychrosphaera aestuarii]
MINAIIVDDEPLAHQVLLHHIKEYSDINVVEQFTSPVNALSWLAKNKTDLIFLDINMPLLNGIDLLKVLTNRPQVVIVSAYQEYAIEGFELDVTDYLLKPTSAERLSVALDKVRQRHALQLNITSNIEARESETHDNFIVLKVNREKRKFEFDHIDYIEAYGNYVKVWDGSQMVLVNSTLKRVLAELPEALFTQVHKSYVVARSRVSAIDQEGLSLSNGIKIKIGKSFRQKALNIL